jgi:prepilin-type N-terminal cleavage/methylation domain-containing protein
VRRTRSASFQAPRGDQYCEDAEGGFTLVEMVIAMAMLTVILTLSMQAVSMVLGLSTLAASTGYANEQASLTLNQLREEIISANILFNPSTEGTNAGTNPDGSSIPAGFSLRIYTELNGVPECVQWRLLDTGALQTRSYSDEWQTDGIVGDWTTLETGVANPQSDPPFSIDAGANFGGASGSRLIDVTLDFDETTKPVTMIQDQASIAARDAEYYPGNTDDCSPVPPA